jgi:uncharacterized protein YacL
MSDRDETLSVASIILWVAVGVAWSIPLGSEIAGTAGAVILGLFGTVPGFVIGLLISGLILEALYQLGFPSLKHAIVVVPLVALIAVLSTWGTQAA